MKLQLFVLTYFMLSWSLPLYSQGKAGKENIIGISIGNQVWSATNQDMLTFQNGDLIPHARSAAEWKGGARGHTRMVLLSNRYW